MIILDTPPRSHCYFVPDKTITSCYHSHHTPVLLSDANVIPQITGKLSNTAKLTDLSSSDLIDFVTLK